MKWEKEAEVKLERVPVFARKIAQAKIEKVARTKGKTVVTLEDVGMPDTKTPTPQAAQAHSEVAKTDENDRFAILKKYDKYIEEDGEPLLFNIDACRGEENNCPFNILSAGKLSEKIKNKLKELKFSKRLLEKTKGPILPHQIFKLGVAGCPNSCSQPQIKDLGVHARATVYVDDTCACTGCHKCLEACKEDAITIDKDRNVTIDNELCIFCGLCAEVCPTGTIKIGAKGHRIMIGGMLGRHPRFASDLIGLATESEVMETTEVCSDLILSENGGKRFGVLVKELGIEEIKKRVHANGKK
jgi:dissimilatory sulfite reductase (desulfoviridin) alpha/beta subunit